MRALPASAAMTDLIAQAPYTIDNAPATIIAKLNIDSLPL
jgi:hypothetical protein